MTTAAEVMAKFRVAVGDQAGRAMDDDELIEAINRFLEDISDESRFIRRAASLHAVEGSGIVKMPTDCIELENLPEWLDEPLTKIDSLWAQAKLSKDWETQTGRPIYYLRDTVGENYLQVQPAPARTVDQQVINGATANDLLGVTDPAVVTMGSTDDAVIVDGLLSDGDVYFAVWDNITYDAPCYDPNLEYVKVNSVDTGAGTMEVARGQLGTTAVSRGNEVADLVVEGAVTFNYVANATSISSGSDTLNLPFRSMRCLMHRLKADFFEKEGPHRNMDMVAFHMARYNEELARIVSRQAKEFDRLPIRTNNSLPEYT